MHHNGALTLPLVFNFFQSFGRERPEPTTRSGRRFDYPSGDAYHFFLDLGPIRNVNEEYFKGEIAFWNELSSHPDYDEFWQSRATMQYLKDISYCFKKGHRMMIQVQSPGFHFSTGIRRPLRTFICVVRRPS